MRPLLHRTTIALILACSGIATATAGEAPEHYSLDPVHTRVMFAISHAGFSNAIGTVSGSTGTLQFDPEHWAGAKLQASVPLARLDLGDDKWNKAAMAGNLLDVDKYPSAEFVSTRVDSIDPNHATAYGMLTLHGVSREIALSLTLNAVKRHPLPPFRRTVGFSASTQISRKDFGITAWPSVIGDTVELRIEAEAVRRRDGDNSPDNATDQPDTASPSPEPTTDPTP